MTGNKTIPRFCEVPRKNDFANHKSLSRNDLTYSAISRNSVLIPRNPKSLCCNDLHSAKFLPLRGGIFFRGMAEHIPSLGRIGARRFTQ